METIFQLGMAFRFKLNSCTLWATYSTELRISERWLNTDVLRCILFIFRELVSSRDNVRVVSIWLFSSVVQYSTRENTLQSFLSNSLSVAYGTFHCILELEPGIKNITDFTVWINLWNTICNWICEFWRLVLHNLVRWILRIASHCSTTVMQTRGKGTVFHVPHWSSTEGVLGEWCIWKI